jgi:hypothetical protein
MLTRTVYWTLYDTRTTWRLTYKWVKILLIFGLAEDRINTILSNILNFSKVGERGSTSAIYRQKKRGWYGIEGNIFTEFVIFLKLVKI